MRLLEKLVISCLLVACDTSGSVPVDDGQPSPGEGGDLDEGNADESGDGEDPGESEDGGEGEGRGGGDAPPGGDDGGAEVAAGEGEGEGEAGAGGTEVGEGEGEAEPGEGEGEGGSGGDGEGAGDGEGEGEGEGGGGQRVGPPSCQVPCNDPRDCARGGVGAFDATRYRCDEGACIYLGCQNDDACKRAFGGQDYVCRLGPDGQHACVRACQEPAECAAGGTPDRDLDNFRCDAGACVYLGCRNDAECTPRDGADRVCAVVEEGQPPQCRLACQAPDDCSEGLPAFDADNHECRGGACVYIGCNDNDECIDSLADPGVRCL